MTRTITPAEIKPGMKIRWEDGGIAHECKVEAVTPSSVTGVVNVDSPEGGYIRVERGTGVTVLAEPQPEEPTAFGARVVAGQDRFLLCDCDDRPWRSVSEDGALGFFADWTMVCADGPVTVIDADPSWEPPANAPAPTTPSDPAQSRPAPWVTSPATPEPWATWEEVPTLTHVRGKSSAAQYCKAKDGTVSIRGAFSGEWRELPGTPKDMDSRGPFTPAHDTQADPR